MAFYHLRLEYSTTSDWTTLGLLMPEHIGPSQAFGEAYPDITHEHATAWKGE